MAEVAFRIGFDNKNHFIAQFRKATVSLAQVAIAWILTKPFISSVIIGANKMQHLEN